MIGHQQQLRRAGQLALGRAQRNRAQAKLAHVCERTLRVGVILLTGVLLFVPLIAVGLISRSSPAPAVEENVEAAVGVAVILRAATHRTVTAAIGGALNTTVSTAVRAGSRAVLQRLVRTTILTIVAVFSLAIPRRYRPRIWDAQSRFKLNSLSIGIGAVAMMIACYGVLSGVGPGLTAVGGEEVVPPLLLASAIGAMPLIVYAASHAVTSRIWSVKVDFTTSLDGLLLQAYFTGAGSFLPLATDIDCEGESGDCMRVAAVGIGSLFAVHLSLAAWVIFGGGGSTVEFASAMALLYAFVFVFPVRPLPGSRIWSHSRGVSVAITVPIIVSFYLLIPEGLAVIV